MISVVIPTCHRNDDLAKCLDLLAPGVQTLAASNYEVIVTDDGSKSTSEQMIREKYPWARWAPGPRRGPAANRNCGARAALGKYIAFTDDDCLPTPDWLRSYADAITAEYEIYEGVTDATGPLRAPFIVAPVNFAGGLLWSCNIMASAQIFKKFDGFDEGFPHAADEDTDFRERLKRAGEKFCFVPLALIYHPPVRRVWGRKSARLWESKVRLGYKADPARQPFNRRELLWYAFRTRARQLKSAPLHLDWLLGFFGMISEMLWIARYTPSWDIKHRKALSTTSKKLGR